MYIFPYMKIINGKSRDEKKNNYLRAEIARDTKKRLTGRYGKKNQGRRIWKNEKRS